MRYAVINAGVVVNTIVAEQAPTDYPSAYEHIMPSDEARMGDLYDEESGTFSHPPDAPEPTDEEEQNEP